jgi:hypothetical protein
MSALGWVRFLSQEPPPFRRTSSSQWKEVNQLGCRRRVPSGRAAAGMGSQAHLSHGRDRPLDPDSGTGTGPQAILQATKQRVSRYTDTRHGLRRGAAPRRRRTDRRLRHLARRGRLLRGRRLTAQYSGAVRQPSAILGRLDRGLRSGRGSVTIRASSDRETTVIHRFFDASNGSCDGPNRRGKTQIPVSCHEQTWAIPGPLANRRDERPRD